MSVGDTGYAEYVSENNYYLVYTGGSTLEEEIGYWFTSSTTDLCEVDAYYAKTEVEIADLFTYFDSNYTYMEDGEDSFYFITSDGNTSISFYDLEDYWGVAYIPISSAAKTNIANMSNVSESKAKQKTKVKTIGLSSLGKTKVSETVSIMGSIDNTDMLKSFSVVK